MIVTLKLWDDEAGVYNQEIATAYGLYVGDMNAMERLFLQYLEYNLYLTPEQVFRFVLDSKYAMQQNNKTNNANNHINTNTNTNNTTNNTNNNNNNNNTTNNIVQDISKKRKSGVPFVFNSKKQRVCSTCA